MSSVAGSVVLPCPPLCQRLWQLLRRRPQLHLETVALLASLFFSTFSNIAFFRAVVATGALHGSGGVLTAVSLFVAITALHWLLLGMLLTRRSAKPLLTVLLLVTALAARFMSQYTVYLDDDMLRNILHTDSKESRELVSLALLPWLLTFGVLPSLLLWRVRLRVRPWRQALLLRAGWLLLAAVLAGGAMLVSFSHLSALFRNHREVRHLITPGNYLVSLGRVLAHERADRHTPRTPIGTQARVVGRAPGAPPRLLVIVVGETVRAQNWGLNGYARQTTPQLAQLQPVNFPDVRACGSATEVSLPCMFSPWGRADYDADRIKHSQSLLHVLEHAGIPTLWRDNQTGCKGVCDGLAFESFEHANEAEVCSAEGCLDEVLLRGLDAAIARRPGDQVVVLHPLGNHGPSYFRRYPPRLRRYLPACEHDDLGQCSRDEIVNAYDNAILYADDFLARTVKQLTAVRDRDTALIYLSDHGESLGEDGLYLHGIPYAIAPDTQTRVPLLMWFSDRFAAHRGLDLGCLQQRAQAPASQDHLFHSVLGLMQVATKEYRPERDLFNGCVAS